jgi:hypothetical protein
VYSVLYLALIAPYPHPIAPPGIGSPCQRVEYLECVDRDGTRRRYAVQVYWAFPNEAHDWGMSQAQTDWVLETLLPGTDPLSIVPSDANQVVRALGSDNYRTREEASARIRMMGPGIVWHLFVGLHSPDQEVRLRCRRLLEYYATCPTCRGDSTRFDQHGLPLILCLRCRGLGRLWTEFEE